jgi:predicted lipoprotein with Yx(FWY)xxD motif
MLSLKRLAVPVITALLVAACSSAATPVPPTAAPPTTAPTAEVTPTAAASAAASAAPSAAASAPVASGSTVMAATAGSAGTVLVAGSNGMTVYTFTKDTANSGTSACSGGCLSKWPALTVPAGTTPTAGAGVTGKLATITRTDDGTLQVTYNGLPLYFYSGDSAPGDINGSYPGWNLVKP